MSMKITKRKIIKLLGAFILFFVIGAGLTAKPCLAASADVELTADTMEVTVGSSIFVYVNINSNNEFGNFEANVTYDDNILEYMGGPSVIKGNSGFLKISDMNVLDGENSRKYTLKFDALEVGICDISFSGPVMVYDVESGYEMSVSSNVLTINVKAPATASKNANLKTLTISPSNLTPEFDPAVTEYNVKVGYETEQLVITALPKDTKSSISISGNDLLKEGENKVVITVLAESGDIIEYTINVNREFAPEEGMDNGTESSPGTSQGSLEIVTINGERYAVYNGKYKILEPDSSVVIPEGYKSVDLFITNKKFTAFVPKYNEESDFILLYAMNELGETGFYQYDKVEKTLQRYVPDSLIMKSDLADENTEDSVQTKEYNANLRKAAFVIAILSALTALLAFLSIRFMLKLKGKK